MKKAILWLQCYWFVPVAVLLAVIVGVFLIASRKRGVQTPPMEPVIKEVTKQLQVIEAGAEVRRVKAELGHEQAQHHVETTYREQLQKLSDDQRTEAAKLAEDPVALSKFLVRAGQQNG